MAIVVSSLTGETVDPAQMARWAYEHGYWCSKSGSYHTLIPGAAQAWGLSVEGCTASEPQRILDAPQTEVSRGSDDQGAFYEVRTFYRAAGRPG